MSNLQVTSPIYQNGFEARRAFFDSSLKKFFKQHPHFVSIFDGLSENHQIVFMQLVSIGVASDLFFGVVSISDEMLDLLDKLFEVDLFYKEMGGIHGYHQTVLELLNHKNTKQSTSVKYHSPSFVNLMEDDRAVAEIVDDAIDHLECMAEIYPLGGAADRLHLVDAETNVDLPAAKLAFAGKTLLEHLILDLEAREHLYFQKFGKKIITPIAIMTSFEKNNHEHVVEIFKKANFFNRPIDSIRFFTQPLVPMVDEMGKWCLHAPLKPIMKPGGHGAIWKLAKDRAIFSWLKNLNKTYAIVRQINNPIAGIDFGLLALIGYGCKNQMKFGFASCPRIVNSQEGMNVLIEKDDTIVLTNVEYTDFAKHNIQDVPIDPYSKHSKYSSNTNILFLNLQAVESAIEKSPYPGLIVNFKNNMARLESTMQNIADVFEEPKNDKLVTKNTFITYNERIKTISSAKKAYQEGKSLQDTPENCFYDLQLAYKSLLKKCGFTLPSQKSLESFLKDGPDHVFLFHPSIGPMFSSIAKKINRGTLLDGSEMQLEVVNIQIKNLFLQGSLRIQAEDVYNCYCHLQNVRIENAGVDWEQSKPVWKMNLKRLQSCKIFLKRNSSLIVKNWTLMADQYIVVEEGQTLLLGESADSPII